MPEQASKNFDPILAGLKKIRDILAPHNITLESITEVRRNFIARNLRFVDRKPVTDTVPTIICKIEIQVPLSDDSGAISDGDSEPSNRAKNPA